MKWQLRTKPRDLTSPMESHGLTEKALSLKTPRRTHLLARFGTSSAADLKYPVCVANWDGLLLLIIYFYFDFEEARFGCTWSDS